MFSLLAKLTPTQPQDKALLPGLSRVHTTVVTQAHTHKVPLGGTLTPAAAPLDLTGACDFMWSAFPASCAFWVSCAFTRPASWVSFVQCAEFQPSCGLLYGSPWCGYVVAALNNAQLNVLLC